MLRILEQVDPGSPFYQHTASLVDERIIRNPPTVPAPTPRGPRRLLCIGMATYDDYDGVYFSVQALRLYHPEITDRTEILVVDNHPSGACARPLKELERQVAGYRYVPYERTQGTAVRDLVFREANAEFVLCMDSHVFFRPGALARLIEYLESHPDSRDLLQGPLLGDDLEPYATHFEPVWRSSMYGTWGMDPRGLDPDAPPFDVPMQGLGVFGCRRAAWPGLNPRLRGFGAEEGYLHEKIRRAGGRTLCLPFLGWLHRFNRPFGPRYPLPVEERVRNYLLVHDELGLDPGPALEHFEQELGAERVRPLVERVARELRGPFHFFDAIYCIDRERGGWAAVVRQGEALGIDQRIRRFTAIDTPERPDIGNALSHRAVVAEARWLGLQTVLVLEDDVRFSRRTADVLSSALSALAGHPWGLLYLGGSGKSRSSTDHGGLEPGPGPHTLLAVAYHHRVYDPILADVPGTPTALARWLDAHRGLGAYYAERFAGVSLAVSPAIAEGADRPAGEPEREPLAVTQ